MSFKPRPILQDMPFHVKQRITRKLELHTEKIALRSFSTDFRQIIRDPEAQINSFKLNCFDGYIQLEIEENNKVLSLEYKGTDQCQVKNKTSKTSYQVSNQDYTQVAIAHFQKYLDNPNLTIGTFSLRIPSSTDHLFLHNLLSPVKILKAESLNIDFSGKQEEVLQVLPHFDSEVLKNVDLWICHDPQGLPDPALLNKEFEKVAQLDQWKNLQRLQLCQFLSSHLPVEHFWHIPDFQLFMFNTPPDSKLPALIEHLRQSTTFRKCQIGTRTPDGGIAMAIGGQWQYVMNGGIVLQQVHSRTNGQLVVNVMNQTICVSVV